MTRLSLPSPLIALLARNQPMVDERIEAMKALAHKRWGYITPWRVGLVAAELGWEGANPYSKPNQADLFLRGYNAHRPAGEGGA